ncbi:MAG: Gfo/Idh/MocA family oxidoreductase [Clostridia bacterium]|nr:Gfo/Idh/MocA family oxidoreductase [Clostridia bacterium]
MQKKIKWGILGYSQIAKEDVIPAILKSSNSEFHAIASRDKDKLKECSDLYKCTKTYLSYDELLDDPAVEAVYIPLPNSLHKQWTINAARKGKHVLCEKPIALNTKECIEMIDECKANRVLLMEALMYKYTMRTKTVKQLVSSGIIGEVKRIHSSFGFTLDRDNNFRLDASMGGGCLYDVGCYPVSFIGMILESIPISVSAECIMQGSIDIDFSAVLKYENGVLCTISSSFKEFYRPFSQIIGTKGLIEVPFTFQGYGGAVTVVKDSEKKEIEVQECDRYILEIEDFADAIINNRQPMVSLEDTLRNMKVIEMLYKTVNKESLL